MRPFIQQFISVASARSEHVALYEDGAFFCSYGSLLEEVKKLAEKMRTHGVSAGDVVALRMPKSAAYIKALLASWFAEAAFVTIDPALPQLRQDFILSEVRPKLSIDAGLSLTLHADSASYSEDLAYIYYTSGSTGLPKGALLSHAGIVPMLEAQIGAFHITPQSRGLWVLSHQFDASLSDVGTILLAGATLCIETQPVASLVPQLAQIIEGRAITHLDLPPSLLRLLDVQRAYPTLETLIIGGEISHSETVREWASKLRLLNVYGPTEATVCTSMKRCEADWLLPNIGKPMPHLSYRLYDAQGNEANEGELWIGGTGLALGYIDRPELTAQKFVMQEGQRFYRTGDWVRQLETGEHVFLGRVDRQLKIRGQLVAPEEIEAALLQHPSVSEAAVILSAHEQLVAYVSGSRMQLHAWLQARLPASMMPARIVWLESLPRNHHGKIDLAQLASRMPEQSLSIEEDHPQVAQLQTIWMEVLHLSAPPSLDADFFDDLGGDSLRAIMLVLAAQAANIPLSLSAVGELRTLRRVMAHVEISTPLEHIDAMPTSTLRAKAIPDETMRIFCAQAVSLPRAEEGKILLTGGAGFLGSYMLRELLEHSPSHIICIVRGTDEEAARSKLWAALAALGYSDRALFDARVQIMLGDITLPYLGLPDDAWRQLAEDVAAIYHCAGRVNMVEPFDLLEPYHLKSVKTLLHLALTYTRKTLHVASTLSVFTASDRNYGICKEDDPFETMSYVYGGYAQSKWAADFYAMQCQALGADVRLYRFGLLTGNFVSGEASGQDHLSLFVRGIKRMGGVLTGEQVSLEMDVTPIDYAARAFFACATKGKKSCYHIAGAGRFTWPQLRSALMQRLALSPQTPEAWLKLKPKGIAETAAYMALCRAMPRQETYAQFRDMDLFQASGMRFNQTNTDSILKAEGTSCPPATDALLARYLDRILDGV